MPAGSGTTGDRTAAARTAGALGHIKSLWHEMPGRVSLAVVLMTVTGIVDTTGVILLPPLLALVGVPLDDGAGGRFQDAVEAALAFFGLDATLPAVLGLFVLVSLVSAGLRYAESLVAASVFTRYPNILRQELLATITRTEWSLLTERSPGDFWHALTSEISRVESATYALLTAASSVMLASVYLTMAFVISPELSGLVVVVAGFMVLVALGFMRRAARLGTAASESEQAVYQGLQDHFGALRLIRAHGQQEQAIDEMSGRFVRATRQRWASSRGYAASRLVIQGCTILALALVVLVAVEYLSIGAASLLVVIYAFGRAMPMVSWVAQSAQLYVTEVAGFQTVHELRTWASSRTTGHSGGDAPVAFEHELRMNSVSFAYPARASTPAVDRLDLRLEKGTTTAIIGPSGSGKSTVCDLLMGLISPTSGHVLIDGKELSSFASAWQRRIAYVPQDPVLFNSSIVANLTWARPEATPDEIDRALRRADAYEFVSRLPAGLDTLVGDRGSNLSAGERQRIALARALLRDPLLLVLDEPTSALDVESARRIHSTIDALRGQLTIVVVSHQLESVRNASHVYVIEAGRIVESGSWEALVFRRDGWLAGQLPPGYAPGPPAGEKEAIAIGPAQANAPGTLLSAYALVTVSLVRVVLWVLPLRPATRVFSAMGRGRLVALLQPGAPPETIAEAVRRSSLLVPRASCLTQAFAGAILMRQAGRSSTVSLGVAKVPGQSLQAHAWLESAGKTLIGGEVVAGFQPVATLEL